MGHPYQQIAQVVDVHQSIISREVEQNQVERGYRPRQAGSRARSPSMYGVSAIARRVWHVWSAESHLQPDLHQASPSRQQGPTSTRRLGSGYHHWKRLAAGSPLLNGAQVPLKAHRQSFTAAYHGIHERRPDVAEASAAPAPQDDLG